MEPNKDSEAGTDDRSGSSSNLRCTQCSAVFEDVLALLAHLDSHASQCAVCSKEFTTKEFLNHHMKTHAAATPGTEAEEEDLDEDKLKMKQGSQNEAVSEGDGKDTEIPVDDSNKESISSRIEDAAAPESGPTDAETEDGKVKEDSPNPTSDETKEDVQECEKNTEKPSDQEHGKEPSSPPPVVENVKPNPDKPYRCSKCKYAAKCVASVNIHQRRQHPGEWTTVISTLDDTEISRGNHQNSAGKDSDESEDEEVKLALKSPLPESESGGDDDDEEEEGEGEERKSSGYRCSMCDFSAQDTDTVFEHQRQNHPGEWQLSSGMGSPEYKEAGVGVSGEPEMETNLEPVYQLPTELDHFSSMGRSIIAGNMDEEQAGPSDNHTNPMYILSSRPTHMVDNQGYNNVTGKYHCSNCPAFFYERGLLRRHHQVCQRTESLNTALAKYRCRICKRIFPNKETLFPHMTNHQRNFPRFRCSVCGYKGKFEGTIVAHIHHRHPSGPPACVEQIAGQEEMNAVPDCWERLDLAASPIDKHLNLEAEDVTDDQDLQQLFGRVSQNINFGRKSGTPQGGSPQESGGDSGSGPVDGDTQSQTSELSDDSTNELGQWNLESLYNLKFGNNYMCPECPVLFREAYKLKRHLDSHGGIKRHVCKICQKRFTRSEHLKRHRVVHANTKPYMCSICCYSAKRLDNLQKHQRVKHPGEQCEIIRVNKEMIEAEITANENARAVQHQLPNVPRPQLIALPKPPQPIIMPVKAKRGRPRKISSPDDTFIFSRDPNFSANATTTSNSLSSASGLLHNANNLSLQNATAQSGNGLHANLSMNLTTGGNLTYNPNTSNPILVNFNSPQPSTSFYTLPMYGSPNMCSTPINIPGFDMSNISAAAAAAVMAPQKSDGNTGSSSQKTESSDKDQAAELAEKSPLASGMDGQGNVAPGSVQTSFHEQDTNKLTMAGLMNRGKYQCHVCERPFSYLKPFKKHLLCHGTFMPYECSVCGHQTKRRDMMQDHQRELHPGQSCEIRVKEPTSDMHDMMDTYIQQVPEQRQQLSGTPPTRLANGEEATTQGRTAATASSTSGIASGQRGNPITISAIDRSMVDPQGVDLTLPLGLVKVEPPETEPEKLQTPPPSPAAQSQPVAKSKHLQHASIIRTRSQISRETAGMASSPGQKPVSQSTPQNQKQFPAAELVVKSESQRSTSSPVVFSPQTPGTGLVRPRPRRASFIKFKVLSPHTKSMSKQPSVPPAVRTDASSREEVWLVASEEEATTEKIKASLGCEDIKEEEYTEEEDPPQTPVKRRRMSEGSHSVMPSAEIKTEVVEDGSTGISLSVYPVIGSLQPAIGKAPKVPIMGLRPGRPARPAAEALVINIKSHKGSPKEKQGDNHRFVCSVCEQRFAYEKPFKRHLLVHGGFEPYKCNACGHHTTSRDSMKIHQHKMHMNQKSLGITVLDPTPEMEQSLIRQGLLQPSVSSDDEENPANKSIVETARMEQHKMAAAMKTLSATVKGQPEKQLTEETSFPLMLGLRPANVHNTKNNCEEREAGQSMETEEGKDSGNADALGPCDDLSDMPVDDAIYVNLHDPSAMLDDVKGMSYTCQYCNKTFHCPSKLQRHMVSHTGIKAYECQICFKKLTRLEHLKRHLLTHGNIKPYRCSACKFDAKRLDIVQLHQQMAHPGETVDIVYLFTPSVMVADTKSGLALGDGASEEGRFGCHVCGLTFVSVNHLMGHQKSHASLKPYECFICHKTFTRPEHLKRHRLVHDDTKPYRCSECGFKTKRLDGMREHQRSRHPDMEVFIIDTILPENPAVKRKRGRPPKFGPRDSLDGLQLLHCDKCCLAFYDQNRFEQHKQMHIPSPSKPQDLTCHICGVRVSQPKHLRRHMLLHENHVPYQCSLCGYTAKRKDHMKLHFRKQHPDGGAHMIHIAKDGSASEASTSMLLSDDSANGSSSFGHDSFFDSYTVGEIEETDLTLEQLNEMAEEESSDMENSNIDPDEGEDMDISENVEEEEAEAMMTSKCNESSGAVTQEPHLSRVEEPPQSDNLVPDDPQDLDTTKQPDQISSKTDEAEADVVESSEEGTTKKQMPQDEDAKPQEEEDPSDQKTMECTEQIPDEEKTEIPDTEHTEEMATVAECTKDIENTETGEPSANKEDTEKEESSTQDSKT